MSEKRTDTITIRVTPSIKREIEKRAKEGFRTVSQEVEMYITKALQKKSVS